MALGARQAHAAMTREGPKGGQPAGRRRRGPSVGPNARLIGPGKNEKKSEKVDPIKKRRSEGLGLL